MKKIMAAAAAFSLCAIGLQAKAAPKVNGSTEPLWEMGIGGGGFAGPAYPGADDQTAQALFVPFIIYRGDVFSIGEEGGARAVAFINEKVELDISLGASLSADASEDADREGMPDLDFLFEIGPQIIYHAARHDFDYWVGHFDIKLRTRAVIGTDFSSFDEHGYIVEPAFVYELKSKRDSRLEVRFDIEILSGSKRLNEYFYSVDPEYETPTRMKYPADAGYIGTELGIGLSLPVTPNFRIFAGLDVELYDQSANQDSPLFKDKTAFSGGIGLVYSFFKSDELVKRQ
jgi:outer membrane scaffolding protein for murein synthesis (MipA/OmpV family)